MPHISYNHAKLTEALTEPSLSSHSAVKRVVLEGHSCLFFSISCIPIDRRKGSITKRRSYCKALWDIGSLAQLDPIAFFRADTTKASLLWGMGREDSVFGLLGRKGRSPRGEERDGHYQRGC